jgi:acyl-coenzyme A synthetase/AMP-(fatty) acid ligase
MSDFPRTPSGKVRKAELRAMLKGVQSGNGEASQR